MNFKELVALRRDLRSIGLRGTHIVNNGEYYWIINYSTEVLNKLGAHLLKNYSKYDCNTQLLKYDDEPVNFIKLEATK